MILKDKYWRFLVSVHNQWFDNHSPYKHGQYFDVSVIQGEYAGLIYTSHEDSFELAESL